MISADIICGVITINIARSLGLNILLNFVVGFGDKTISDYSTLDYQQLNKMVIKLVLDLLTYCGQNEF